MKIIISAINELLIDCGYSKPIPMITLMDKDSIVNTISLHHLILKVKAELDQLRSGLETLGVAAAMKLNPKLFQPLFTRNGQIELTPGIF